MINQHFLLLADKILMRNIRCDLGLINTLCRLVTKPKSVNLSRFICLSVTKDFPLIYLLGGDLHATIIHEISDKAQRWPDGAMPPP